MIGGIHIILILILAMFIDKSYPGRNDGPLIVPLISTKAKKKERERESKKKDKK